MIEVPKPSEAEVERAAALRSHAATIQAAAPLEDLLEEPFEDERETLLWNAEPSDEELVSLRYQAEQRAEARTAELRAIFLEKIRTPEDVAWAVTTIKTTEDEAARRKREAQAIVAAAEARERRTKAMLWPVCEAWARSQPPTKKNTKTWRLPGTTMHLRGRSAEASVEVLDEQRAVEWIEANVPYEEREPERGEPLIRVQKSVRAGAFRDWLEPRVSEALALQEAAAEAEARAAQLRAAIDGGDPVCAEVLQAAERRAAETRAAANAHAFDPRKLRFIRYQPAGDRLSIFRR